MNKKLKKSLKLKYEGLTSGVTKIKKNGIMYYVSYDKNLIITELKRRIEVLS